jgi:BASS family bile acid:Na+ symporter
MTMFFITAIPVGLGLFIHTKFQKFTQSFEPTAGKISTVLFVIIVIGALVSEWDAFIANVGILGPAIITLILSMLIIGFNSARWFKLGHKRSVTVSIESGIQNATIGITVGNLILSQETGLSVLSLPSGVYGILMYIVCLPIMYWYIRQRK